MNSQKIIQQFCWEYDQLCELNSLRGWKHLLHELSVFDADCRKYGRGQIGLYEASPTRCKFVIAPGVDVFFECPDAGHTIEQRIEQTSERFLKEYRLSALDGQSKQIWHDLNRMLSRLRRTYGNREEKKVQDLMGRYRRIHDLKEAEIHEMMKGSRRERCHA